MCSDRASALTDLLLELQALDRVDRVGFAIRGVARPESVAEHSWHVAFLVWALGRRVERLDLLRALELAMVHDTAEVRLGDIPRTGARHLPAGAKKHAERSIVEDLLQPLGRHAQELADEYNRGETSEARFVRVCDRLQLLLKAHVYEHWREGDTSEFWHHTDSFDDGGFDAVRAVLDELVQRRRKAASS